MYTLHWNQGSASLVAHMALEETGVPYKLKLVDMDKGEHKTPEYLKLNPNGKVPALALDGGGVMFETNAIAMYLADRHPQSGLAPAIADPDRALYTQWMFHLTNSIQPLYLLFYYPERHTTDPAHVAEIKAKAMEQIGEAWDRIERSLAAKGPYMLGARYSAADLPVVMLSNWQQAQPEMLAKRPNLRRLVELVAARPAVKRVLVQNQLAA
jgi:glutathione S-transferase